MSIRRWEFFPCLLGPYFTEIFSCFLAQTFLSVVFIMLPLASHFCAHKIILFCLPEHSNHNLSRYSVKLYIFSSSSFLINQSFQPHNNFSCCLNCLQFVCSFPSNEVAQNWMVYSRQAATKIMEIILISIICCLTKNFMWIHCKKKSVPANVIVLKTYTIFMLYR